MRRVISNRYLPRISPKLGVFAAALCAGTALWPAFAADSAAIPNFSPTPTTAWSTNRPTSDDFIPPPSGAGPVMSDPAHPYVPNGGGRQPTYRIADLTNPILKPWVIEKMKKANDDVMAGKVPYIARERCWPAGVPALNIYTRGQPIYFIQTAKQVLIVNELNTQIRHVYLNVPHSAHVTPTWYGESVGHYDGDELVIDTIGLNDKTFVDNYRTPHTDQLHVVERFKMIDGGKTLQVTMTVEDSGAYNMPWTAIQRWRRLEERAMLEEYCAENNVAFFGYDVVPIPQADKADF
ncbi:MAG TPA: hypothetical protein VK479_04650 [Micropepsaceae bacterium]|nr:hypothetical protein [Micropepsaceae bacterium]